MNKYSFKTLLFIIWVTRRSLSTTNLAVLLNSAPNCINYIVLVTKECTWSTGGAKMKAAENQCKYLLWNLTQCHYAHHKSHTPAKSQVFVLCHVNPFRIKYCFSSQHQHSSRDTAKCMQWVLYLLPIMEGVRGFQEVHEREDRAQSKLPRVLSATKWNMIIFIGPAWIGKRDVPTLLPVLLSNKSNERGTSCFNIFHMLWMFGLVETNETLHRMNGK